MHLNYLEKELNVLVEVLKKEIPSLLEVRVFGSYNNGNFNREKSDIDIFVLLGDEKYSVYNVRRMLDSYKDIESNQRQSLRKKLINRIASNKISFYILTLENLLHLVGIDEGRGDIGRSMVSRRLLYRSKLFK
ncbi:MAG: nucleotidyltransferase domain-containing protein [Nanoarchaeota archaeon]